KRALIAGLLFAGISLGMALPMGLSIGLLAGAQAGESELGTLVQDVQAASGYRYGARDDRGNSLDALKIINNPDGGYIGVYHVLFDGVYYVKVGTSGDLLNWKTRTVLATHGSQPTITRLSDGGFLVVYEQDTGCIGAGAPLTAPNG